MSRTAAFGEHLDSLGIWWPRGDGDALRLSSTSWSQMASVLEEIGEVLDGVADSIVENYRGTAAEKFHKEWQRYTGPGGYVSTTAGHCRQLAASLDDFGGDIDRADDTLINLIEQALQLQSEAAAVNADPTAIDEWLRECAAAVAAALSGNADQRANALATIERLQGADMPADMAAIDPGSVDWVDPGDPDSLANLAYTPVDFGAGQGEIKLDFELPDPDGETPPAGEEPGGDTDLPPLPDPDDLGAGAGGGGAGGGGGASGFGGGGGAGGFDAGSFSLDDAVPDEVPFSDGALLAGAAGAVGAVGTAAAAAAKSGRFPFMPMMPMGAGGGGDDGNEPRRKSLRRRRPAPESDFVVDDPGR